MMTTIQSDVNRQKVFEDWKGRRSFSMFPFNVKQLVELVSLFHPGRLQRKVHSRRALSGRGDFSSRDNRSLVALLTFAGER
jgi:hypothetical protein